MKKFLDSAKKIYRGNLNNTLEQHINKTADYLNTGNYDNATNQNDDTPTFQKQDEQPSKIPFMYKISQQQMIKRQIMFKQFLKITRQMKIDLIDLGYQLDEIKHLTPIQAHEILQEQIRNK